MRYRKCLLVAAALMVIGLTSIKPAMAYFTDFAQATGAKTIHVGDSELPPPEDNVENMIKTVAISNTGDYDVFVRVKAIYPSNVTVKMDKDNSKGWSLKEDGYYYYGEIVKANKENPFKTNDLKLKIEAPKDATEFNVIIVQEATKVLYKDGEPYADWNAKVTVKEEVKPEQTSGEATDDEENN